MIVLKRGLCVLLAIGFAAVAQAQTDDQRRSITERLTEVQEMIDREITTISALEKQLNQAVDDNDASRIKTLNEEIKASWDRVQTLKELKRSIEELLDGFHEVRPDSGFRSSGGGDGAFSRDNSTLDKPRALGFLNDDGETTGAAERLANPRRKERPSLARPRGELRKPDPSGEQAGADRDRSRRDPPPERAVPGGGDRPPAGDTAGDGKRTGNTSARLESLRRSHSELIAAGEFDLAARIMELIREEKQQLADARQNQADDRTPPRRGAGGGASTEPGKAGGRRNPPGRPATEDALDQTVRDMQKELDRLRDELQKLRDNNRSR